MLISALTFAYALFVGLALSRSIATPIRRLNAAVERLGKGPAGESAPILATSRDEIGQLSRAFNEMVERLEKTTVSRDALADEVAERRRAEQTLATTAAELKRSNQELEHEIAERTGMQRALIEHSHELARSNSDLEQFAYIASHDLQEPLRMVSSYTQLLARRYGDKLDEDAQVFISYAVEGAERMGQLITDVLTYSRVGTETDEFELANCDRAFDLAVANLRSAIEESKAEVVRDPLPAVKGDEIQIAQLFQNLIANALKFRDRRSPRVYVSAKLDGDTWVVSVRDNGIGIAPEYAHQIFGVFQRLHTRAHYPGNGIGLAMCKKIVERHGGRIWMESEPGHGATFYFTLPGGRR